MAKIYHVLNGDALRNKFPDTIDEKVIVFRECLIEGPVIHGGFNEFFALRSKYIKDAYNISEQGYQSKSIKELSQLLDVPDETVIHLWFEHDLFCQVNLWYTIFLLNSIGKELTLRIVYPLPLEEGSKWFGFGAMNTNDLMKCLEKAKTCNAGDIEFAIKLWKAYVDNEVSNLNKLKLYQSPAFPETGQAIQAHLDRIPTNESPGRPQRRLKELIVKYGSEKFNVVFKEFQKSEGIYGFGDLQVKSMFDQLI